MNIIRLPNPPSSDDTNEWRRWAASLIQALAVVIDRLSIPAGSTYDTDNVIDTRSLDVSTATLTDTKNVLGTLIQDLRSRGLIA